MPWAIFSAASQARHFLPSFNRIFDQRKSADDWNLQAWFLCGQFSPVWPSNSSLRICLPNEFNAQFQLRTEKSNLWRNLSWQIPSEVQQGLEGCVFFLWHFQSGFFAHHNLCLHDPAQFEEFAWKNCTQQRLFDFTHNYFPGGDLQRSKRPRRTQRPNIWGWIPDLDPSTSLQSLGIHPLLHRDFNVLLDVCDVHWSLLDFWTCQNSKERQWQNEILIL